MVTHLAVKVEAGPDMEGLGAVLAAVHAVAMLFLPVHLVTVLTAVRLPAVLAAVRLFSSVAQHVFSQGRANGEFRWTFFALERFISVVSSHMNLQTCTGVEPLITQGTRKFPYALVHGFRVTVQLPGGGESTVTLLAVMLFPIMLLHVAAQADLAVVLGATDFTLFLLLPMKQLVLAQAGLVLKRLPTLTAGEGSVLVVVGHVVLQLALHLEEFPAPRAQGGFGAGASLLHAVTAHVFDEVFLLHAGVSLVALAAELRLLTLVLLGMLGDLVKTVSVLMNIVILNSFDTTQFNTIGILTALYAE